MTDNTNTPVVDEDAPLVFDTLHARKPKTIIIDGVTYRARPLGSAEYFKLVEKSNRLQEAQQSKLDPRKFQKLQDDTIELILPIFEPNDKFRDVISACKKEAGFDYYAMMTRIIALVMPKQQ